MCRVAHNAPVAGRAHVTEQAACAFCQGEARPRPRQGGLAKWRGHSGKSQHARPRLAELRTGENTSTAPPVYPDRFPSSRCRLGGSQLAGVCSAVCLLHLLGFCVNVRFLIYILDEWIWNQHGCQGAMLFLASYGTHAVRFSGDMATHS